MTDPLDCLLPGFLRFTSVGAVCGCADVERALAHALRPRGVEARTVRCNPRPTASIPRSAAAARVAAAVAGEG